MKNYLVLCNFASYVEDECELFTNQWTVGSFDTLEECYEACEKDIKQVAYDTYKCVYNEDEKEDCEDKVKDFLGCAVKHHKKEIDLLFLERALVYNLEYVDIDLDTKTILDYSIIKI